MGNCLKSSKIVTQKNKFEQQSPGTDQTIKESTTTRTSVPSKIEQPKHVEGGKATMVRFRLNDEDVNTVDEGGETGDKMTSKGGGAVRIRVVVTKEDLKQILNFRKNINNSSMEQLVRALRLRERRRSSSTHDQVGTSSTDHGGIMSGGWKPVLGSIPEEH